MQMDFYIATANIVHTLFYMRAQHTLKTNVRAYATMNVRVFIVLFAPSHPHYIVL